MNGSSASAITALTALADYARDGDHLIETITERMGVELTREQNIEFRAALAGAAKTFAGHLDSHTTDVAREITERRAWAATTAEVNE